MKSKVIALLLVASIISLNSKAQDKEEKEKVKVPFKENLFTGGSISLAFYNNTFLVGGNPVLGYSITNWADLGLVINYTYSSYRDYNFVFNDKLKQYVYGGGGFVKLYPVKFLFAQAQYEYNFIKQKFIPNVGVEQEYKGEAGSFLIGGGYTTGRYGRGGGPHFYLAVLFDISNKLGSPYLDSYGRTIPIIRGGIQIPLFQGGGRSDGE